MKFTIGFEKEDKNKLYSYFDAIIASNVWSEGKFVKQFEENWAEYVGTKYAVAFSSWFGAAMSAFQFLKRSGGAKQIICPSNTFAATPFAILNSGSHVLFADCNRLDLCLSKDFHFYVEDPTKIIGCFLVHIGGHISRDTYDIVSICKKNNWFLLEDCAHAHGASWFGRKAGTFGDAGIYSFYATKTITTGEGGMLVTDNQALAEYAKMFRNYGKPSYLMTGCNLRMSEFTAAIGCVQTERLDDIVEWKTNYVKKNYEGKYETVPIPAGMKSGYYKYIIFDEKNEYKGPVTGAVYDQPCHKLLLRSNCKTIGSFNNTESIAKNHKCLPVYYKGDE